MDDSEVSPELSRALQAAERPERLALGLLTAVALVGGVGLDGALGRAGHPRLGEVAGQGLYWGAVAYTYLRWTGRVSRRAALATALALLAWLGVWAFALRPAARALWHLLVG